MTFRVAIDGSNMLKPQSALPWSVAYLQAVIDEVRASSSAAVKNRPLRLNVLVDASTFYKLTEPDQAVLEQMEARGELERTPAKTEADPWILKWADENEALVISNDAYKRWQREYPWVTTNGRLVGAMFDRHTKKWTLMERNYGDGIPRSLVQLLKSQNDLPLNPRHAPAPWPSSSTTSTRTGGNTPMMGDKTHSSSGSGGGGTPPPTPVPAPTPPTQPMPSVVAHPIPYEREITRQHPALMVLLLDQSGSMQSAWYRGGTKADGVAETVNNLIQEIVLLSIRQKEVRHYFDLAVIGYSGSTVTSMFQGTDIGNPIITCTRANEIVRRETVMEQGLRIERHVWVESRAAGQTPMCLALRTAKKVAEKWAAEHADSFPPIVLNITDGAGNDGVPLPIAEELLQVSTKYGSALLMNCHIAGKLDQRDSDQLTSNDDKTILFPDEKFPLPSQYARDLFEMSSALPESFRRRAIDLEFNVTVGARGYMYNATRADVARFFKVGTPPPARR
jgi:uncharacterized protein YegL